MAHTITRAHARAQRRFHEMAAAQVYGDPTDRRTRLYVQAERLIDRLRGEPVEFDIDSAHDVADWRFAVMTGDYAAGVALPDVPLAFVPEGEARAMWGNR